MREISLSSEDWTDLSSDLDPLANATEAEWAQVWDAVAETSEQDGWAMTGADGLAAEIASLPDAGLAALEAEGAGYPAAMRPGSEFASWLDAKSDAEFSDLRGEAQVYGAQELPYLQTVHQIDRDQAAIAERKAVMLSQDASEREARRGAHHRRPRDEDCLARGLRRFQQGTYVPAQLIGLAGDSDADDLFSGPVAAPADVLAELRYQLTGGLAPARARRQALPPVQRLARTIGLR
jgi:hypothetical protein